MTPSWSMGFLEKPSCRETSVAAGGAATTGSAVRHSLQLFGYSPLLVDAAERSNTRRAPFSVPRMTRLAVGPVRELRDWQSL